jgi:hypothetical protein
MKIVYSKPISRGPRPERDAPTGALLKTEFASESATLGSTILPEASLAYCCTSWR